MTGSLKSSTRSPSSGVPSAWSTTPPVASSAPCTHIRYWVTISPSPFIADLVIHNKWCHISAAVLVPMVAKCQVCMNERSQHLFTLLNPQPAGAQSSASWCRDGWCSDGMGAYFLISTCFLETLQLHLEHLVLVSSSHFSSTSVLHSNTSSSIQSTSCTLHACLSSCTCLLISGFGPATEWGFHFLLWHLENPESSVLDIWTPFRHWDKPNVKKQSRF